MPDSSQRGGQTLDTTAELGHVARILLAEDDDEGREVIATALRLIGAEVDAVADGGRLLVAIAAQYRDGNVTSVPDLIVTDVVMPVCSGLAVLEALRAAHWTIPFIVIAGRDTPAVRSSVAKFRATLMLKPLDLIVLQETAQHLIRAAKSPSHA
jgi:CheY-like chemotaxis protein